jgi:hypothetical protein
MPRSSLRSLSRVSVAFFLLAACTELYDTDRLAEGDRSAEDEEDPADAAVGDVPDSGGGGDDGDGDDSDPDGSPEEPDASPAECGQVGESCNADDEFFECNEEGECAECGRGWNLPCCRTAPFCDGALPIELICTDDGLCL